MTELRPKQAREQVVALAAEIEKLAESVPEGPFQRTLRIAENILVRAEEAPFLDTGLESSGKHHPQAPLPQEDIYP